MNTGNNNTYSGIAPYYEKWCLGDSSYLPSKDFYIDCLSQYSGNFLELGVGTGRIALEIIKKQPVSITGLDASPNMITECNNKYQLLLSENQCVGNFRIIRGDISFFEIDQLFDVIYLPFRTVGHLLTDCELYSLFHKVYSHLKNQGIFIVDHYVFDKGWALEHNDIDILMYQDYALCIQDHYIYDFLNEVMHCSIKINGSVVDSFDFKWIHPEKMKLLAAECDFSVKHVYGDFDFSEFTLESPNQIWVFEKKG